MFNNAIIAIKPIIVICLNTISERPLIFPKICFPVSCPHPVYLLLFFGFTLESLHCHLFCLILLPFAFFISFVWVFGFGFGWYEVGFSAYNYRYTKTRLGFERIDVFILIPLWSIGNTEFFFNKIVNSKYLPKEYDK